MLAVVTAPATGTDTGLPSVDSFTVPRSFTPLSRDYGSGHAPRRATPRVGRVVRAVDAHAGDAGPALRAVASAGTGPGFTDLATDAVEAAGAMSFHQYAKQTRNDGDAVTRAEGIARTWAARGGRIDIMFDTDLSVPQQLLRSSLGSAVRHKLELGVWSPVVDDLVLQTLVRSGSALRELSLAGCRRVTAAGLRAAINKLPPLVSLDVSGIGDAGNDWLFHHIRTKTASLRTLAASQLPSLTDAGLRQIAKHSSSLQRLRIAECPLLADVRCLTMLQQLRVQ